MNKRTTDRLRNGASASVHIGEDENGGDGTSNVAISQSMDLSTVEANFRAVRNSLDDALFDAAFGFQPSDPKLEELEAAVTRFRTDIKTANSKLARRGLGTLTRRSRGAKNAPQRRLRDLEVRGEQLARELGRLRTDATLAREIERELDARETAIFEELDKTLHQARGGRGV